MDPELNVLIIEDSESDAAMVVRLLSKAGYAIHHHRVETAEELRSAFDDQAWDVVISDYDMPQFSGPAALEQFKTTGLEIPFIVLSGAVGEETIVKMMKLGAHDYVMKGNLTRLVPTVEREIREASFRLERRKVDEDFAQERYLLGTLLDKLPDRIYFKDLQSKFIRISRSQAEIFGLENALEAYGKTDFDFFSDEHARLAFDSEQNIINTGQAIVNFEEKETWPDGRITWVNSTKMPLTGPDGKIIGTYGLSRDVTEQKRAEILIKVRMLLLEYAASHVIEEILRYSLDQVGEITGSPIGFYHFVDEDQKSLTLQAWSTRTIHEFCKADGKGSHYDLDQAGVWVDAVKLRQAVIHNDYAALSDKKGMPEGHAVVTRELVVPIFRQDRVVAIMGVGNKALEYTEQDVEVVTYLSDIAWEIVTRKRAEAAVWESQHFLQDIIDALAINLCVLDEKGKVLMVNQVWREFADVNPLIPSDDCLGMNYIKVCESAKGELSEEAASFVEGLYSVMWGDSEFFLLEYPCKSPNDEERWFGARVTRFIWEGSLRIVVTHTNITQRKLAEKVAGENEARYRSLYENVPVGIYRSTPGGKILMANPTLVRMLGYETFNELAERNLEEEGYESGFSREDFKKRIVQDGQIQGLEAGIKRKDGSIVDVRENAHVVVDDAGRVQFYEGTIEDITEMRRSELQNLRLVAAIEHAGETIILSDPSGEIKYANPAFEEMFGVAVNDIVGKNIVIFSNAYQNLQVWQAMLNIPRNGKVWRGDIRANHADGRDLEIETTISPILGMQGEISSLVFVMHNVTQERKAEIQHRQSQKLEAIGHLAAGIAHEINTPTQFIGNNIRFLQNGFQDLSRLVDQIELAVQSAKNEVDLEQLKGKIKALAKEMDFDFLKEEIPAAIDGSLKGIDRVTKIVSAMKEFSHPGTHEKVVADINHAIENTLVVSHNEWKYVAEMQTDLDPDLPQIPCLIDEFNQVILNLITNAADAIRESKSSTTEDEKGIISISTQRAEPWIVIKVSDNGLGIPRNIQDRIFDPFFTTKEVGKGTGQGLPISYDVIVNKHQGEIRFETEEGKGTTFIIHLPMSPK